MLRNFYHRLLGRKSSELPLGGHPASSVFSQLDALSDAELSRLNQMLPWSSWVTDANGRRFGDSYSTGKRAEPETIPDPRITELNQRFDLQGKTVLEIGCFEGNHTIALCNLGASVLAIDARVENVVKTLARCAMSDNFPSVYCADIDGNYEFGREIDVVHHVGVLYHLKDPVSHLKCLLPKVRQGLMLDTHVAPEHEVLETLHGIRFWTFSEHGRDNPFAGMNDYARWLHSADLRDLLQDSGFRIDKYEERIERNGPRVLIYACRTEK